MAMKPSLQVRLSQHLALTPQLQQSIRLLQLSTLELQQEVDQMLQQNPFLENDDDANSYGVAPVESAGPLQNAGTRSGEADEADSINGDDTLAEISGTEFGGTERDDWENGTEGDDFDGIGELPGTAAATSSDDDDPRAERESASASLQDHLRAQTVGMRLDDEDQAALYVLIESLDADGYLADSLDDIAQRLTAMFGTNGVAAAEQRQALLQRLQIALKWLQSMDPAGVGARNLSECLCLQLRRLPASPERAVALSICEAHLEVLARRDLRRLALMIHVEEDRVRAAQALIQRCEPKPGRAFQDTEHAAIVPDVIVRRAGRGWRVALNPEVMPKLRINELYARAARSARGSGLGPRLQEARWFMRNIQQRFDTILRVASAIVERQKAFFAHGEIAMKPLVLREIADELGLHESTISRVTTAKYLTSPQGTFELKYFFGSSLATETGGNASSTAVRALIRQFIDAEEPAKPLSDSQLSQMLEEQGIHVARRTVAKYREGLRIAPANLRRAG